MKKKKALIALIYGGLFLSSPVAAAEPPASPPASAKLDKDENDFIYRVAMGRADDVRLTLQSGQINPRQSNRDGVPAIAIAAGRNDDQALPIVMMLLGSGAGVNDCDSKNNCPLTNAVKAGSIEVVGYLLEAGADYNVRDESSRTPLEIAQSQNNTKIVELLESAQKRQTDEVSRMRQPEYLNAIIGRFAFVQCASQYATYFLTSEQGSDAENKKFKLFREQYVQLGQKYFSTLERFGGTPPQKLVDIARSAKKEIYDELSEMVSNRERKAQGIGSEADIIKRCNAIASHWNVQAKTPAQPKQE